MSEAETKVRDKLPDAEVHMVSRVVQIRYRVFAGDKYWGNSQKSVEAAWQSAAIEIQLFGIRKFAANPSSANRAEGRP